MPEPIINTSQPPWSSAAEATLRLNDAQLQGPSTHDVQAAQRDHTLKAGVAGLGTSGVIHLLGEYASAVGGVSGGLAAALAGPGATLLSLAEGYAQQMVESDQLNEAYRRDAVHLAVTWLAAKALPNDFVQNRAELYRAADSNPGIGHGPANRLLNRLLQDGHFQEAMQLAQQQASAGRDMALRLNIGSARELQQRLATDTSFAALYNAASNVAFRLGVDSVVWQAEHPAAVHPQNTGAGT